MSEKTTARIMPMPVVHPVWEHDGSEYPDKLQVSFCNGKVRTYQIRIEQPKPHTLDAETMAHIMRRATFGGYKGKHEKK